MKPALLRPQARKDQRTQVNYHRDHAGARIAEKLVIATEEALDQIERQPRLGSPVLGKRLGIDGLIRTWPVSAFPLMWCYIEAPRHLDVIRLLSDGQDIGATLSSPAPHGGHEPAVRHPSPPIATC